ncbi:multiple epidermal growth factor-like domains protein 6 [Mya arenaria]|uniref:multiple epidermal growth factor-like domains protein 6 n=1 Tax=Mya arenaria TaxID=6604 RepID=UPI0022E09E25|nr:multiple epidermal growth factor-like domains protein 6 [Mya arenaria]
MTACDPGEHGPGCTSHCGHCRDDKTTCNINNGSCPYGCSSGYKEDLCSIRCAPGEFGPNCASNCGYCHDGNTTCDTNKGHCPTGCAAGYKGDFCKTNSFKNMNACNRIWACRIKKNMCSSR